MPDALQLAIDPYLLCLPNPCNSPGQIEAFVNALLDWSSMLRLQNAHILIADAARIALLEDGEYPHHHRLRDLLHEHRCEVADHETVCRLTQDLLDQTLSLEDFYGVHSILIDATKTRVVPEALLTRLKDKTRAAFIEMLVIVSIEQIAASASPTKLTFIASATDPPDESVDPVDVECDSELHDWEWVTEPRHALPPLPVAVSGKIPLALSHSALLQQLGVWAVWKNATDEQAAIEAINLCIMELEMSGASTAPKADFRLGSGFLESARTWGFGSRSDYARLLIESCARIVIGIPKNSIDVFRESTKSSRQRCRYDGALGYRTHLTKKGAGFRLMLWKQANGTIEFANVGDKDELVIL